MSARLSTMRFPPLSFRVLRKPILLRSDNATRVVQCCVALHNFLMDECRSQYLPASDLVPDEQGFPRFVDPEDDGTEGPPQVPRQAGNRSGNKAARDQRERLADFFMNDGQVSFQWKNVFGSN